MRATTRYYFELDTNPAAYLQICLRSIQTCSLDPDRQYTTQQSLMDHRTLIESRKRARSAFVDPDLHIVLPMEKHSRITSTSPELQCQEHATLQTVGFVHGQTLLYPPGTPISYTFHSCDITLIREALRLIHTEDLPLHLNLDAMTFSLPKYLDDDGRAISWLVSLATCLAWCFHDSPTPDIIIAEPELGVEEPYITVNEGSPPNLGVDPHAGFTNFHEHAGLSTTATDLVHLFLDFAQGLPSTELATEEQVIFALADFLHNRPDKCKSCILWRAAWKECLSRLYGEVVAKSMAKQRRFEPT